tara:strand:+ start:985 stop:1776 length:792 start_codon:yes stop_codon:yes gene_type:complete
MRIKKPFIFLKALPKKLNEFYINQSKRTLIVRNKSFKKNEFNPVTNLDKSFEKFIRSLLLKSFPDHGILGEEFKTKKTTNSYQWSIDPIDGTKAFVIGVPTWSNLIGLMFKGKSTYGLANFPELNKFYISDDKFSYLFKDKKKYVNKCSKKTTLKKIKIIGNFNNNNKINNIKMIKKFGSSFRSASFDALSYCLLAQGKIDAVIETNLKSYDIIPLIPIIENAGGCISNWKNGSAEKGGNIIASSNRKLHKKLLKVIKQLNIK